MAAKRKAPALVRPANPAYAAAMADRARGSRAGKHGAGQGRNRANTRQRVMAFERNAA
jgi:hypothetical protein